MFRKSNVAIITPFKNGEIDYSAFQELVKWQMQSGTNGILVCGSTGEAITLTSKEKENLIKSCIEVTKNKLPVMVGTGSSSTQETIENTKKAQALGADAVLVVTPYYNKPTQEGIFQHFKAVSEATDIPIYIYNNPGRAVINISDTTVARIAGLKSIAGIKDSSPDISRPIKLRNLVANSAFTLLTGEDPEALAYNAHGGEGIVSITANIAPKLCAELQGLCAQGNFPEALKLQKKLMALHTAMTCETNPIPVKYALSLLGKTSAEVRLPLVELQSESKARVEQAMKEAGLI